VAKRIWLLVAQVGLTGVLITLALGTTAASGDTSGPPVSTYPPTVTGAPGVGKTLSTTDGSWSTSATFTYQWLRCTALYANCIDIPGATAATYTMVAADVGHVLGARVTATNAAGSTSAISEGDGPVEANPPRAKNRPWIKGTKKVGQRLYALGVTWTGSPYVFTQGWLRCSLKGSPCVRIRRVAGSDYKLRKRDAGHRIRVRVAAWNGAGRGTATSLPTRVIEK
jgi:hypothetical protein